MTPIDHHICFDDEETPEEYAARWKFSNARAGLIHGILTIACLCGGAVLIKGLWGWIRLSGQ